MTFRLRIGSTLGEGGFEVKTFFTVRVDRFCCLLLCPLYRSLLLRILYSKQHMVLGNICSMGTLVVSFAKDALQRNAKKGRLLGVSRPC